MNTPEETNDKAPGPLSIGDLGRKLTIEEVAEIFDVTSSAVERCPTRYGGVKVGRQRLFFENLVVEMIRACYKRQMLEEGIEISSMGNDNAKVHNTSVPVSRKPSVRNKEFDDPFGVFS